MKKFTLFLVAIIAVVICCSGCDPKKTGGGGKSQSYDSSTGRYK